MGIDLLVRHPWAACLVWAVLFVADYALTLRGARLAETAADTVAVEGSYQLNPFHAPTIEARRAVPMGVILQLAAPHTWSVGLTRGTCGAPTSEVRPTR